MSVAGSPDLLRIPGVGPSVMSFSRITGRPAWRHWISIVVLPFLVCSCQQLPVRRAAAPEAISDRHVAALNALRNEINLVYGFENGRPRINRGPCGRFAKLFCEHWNARFTHKVNIVFVMTADTSDGVGCSHVLVRLPCGNYYDGGSGVIPGETLLRQFEPEHRIEEMLAFDLALLDKRSYGLNRSYELCPNYSDETTARIIEKYLALLPKD